MDEERKQKIIGILQTKGAILPCPRCGRTNFTLIDGYFNQSIQKELSNNLMIGGPSIPSIGVVCTNCGFMAHHAAGVLELLPPEEKKHGKE